MKLICIIIYKQHLKQKSMKANLTSKIFFSILIGMSSITAHGQENGKIWATIQKEELVPILNSDGLLSSNNETFNSLISSLSITRVVKALPASKQEKLQKVYEITCNCSEQVLLDAFTKQPTLTKGVVLAPKYETLYTPNDYSIAFPVDYALNLINASGAWDITQGNSNVVIGISDQNYYVNHDELVGKVNYYDASNTNTQTHGTAVAIIAAGNTDNNIGKSSIGFNSSLALYQMSFNEIIAASYAGLDIINVSWMSGCFYNQYAQDAIDEAYNNGSFIIAAAGNGFSCGGPDQLVYPAALANVFSVTSIGASDNHEKIIGDPTSTHQHNVTVDLSAPGYDVAITAAPGWYFYSSGTSYAAPLVSGIVALMLDVNPCLNNLDIEYILKNSSQNIDVLNPNYAGKIGSGRVDAQAAVLMASTFVSAPFQTNAVVTGSCIANSSSILINPIGGQAPYTIQWSNNYSGLFQDSLAIGSYDIHLVDAHGCILDTTIDIVPSSPTVINANQTNVSCFGLGNGAIDVSIVQGVPSYSYAWDNGATTEDLSALSPGTYRLTLTDGNGCVTYVSYSISEPDDLTASASTSPANNTNNGAIDLNVTGGTPAYSYLWSNNETTEDLSNLSAGIYNVTVTDANGCQAVIQAEVIAESTNSLVNLTSSDWSIFPNPAVNNATIEWNINDIDELIITDSNGKITSRKLVSNENKYEVENLESGIYFINLYQLNEKVGSKKLIVL
jgi:hypothetical protein